MRGLAEELWIALQEHVHNVVLLDETDSSHSMAIRLMMQMDNEGLQLPPTVLLAARQRRGRGRGDRGWVSPAGGLYLNWIGSGLDNEVITLMPMIAAAAAHQALVAAGVGKLSIKWPNDLLVDGAKLAGLLVHARRGDLSWVTVGIGINLLHAPQLDDPEALLVTSLAEQLGRRAEELDWQEQASSLTIAFLTALRRGIESPEQAQEYWRRHLAHRPGDHLRVRLGSGVTESGSFAGLTSEGYLRLHTGNGEQIISSGDLIETA